MSSPPPSPPVECPTCGTVTDDHRADRRICRPCEVAARRHRRSGPGRRCRRCRRSLPPAAFSGPTARICEACRSVSRRRLRAIAADLAAEIRHRAEIHRTAAVAAAADAMIAAADRPADDDAWTAARAATAAATAAQADADTAAETADAITRSIDALPAAITDR